MAFESSKHRAKRYCDELKARKHLSGKKKDKPLTDSEASFRMGVINQRVRQGKAAANKKRGKQSKNRQTRSPSRGAYNASGKINEKLVDDLKGPVVFFDGERPF